MRSFFGAVSRRSSSRNSSRMLSRRAVASPPLVSAREFANWTARRICFGLPSNCTCASALSKGILFSLSVSGFRLEAASRVRERFKQVSGSNLSSVILNGPLVVEIPNDGRPNHNDKASDSAATTVRETDVQSTFAYSLLVHGVSGELGPGRRFAAGWR